MGFGEPKSFKVKELQRMVGKKSFCRGVFSEGQSKRSRCRCSAEGKKFAPKLCKEGQGTENRAVSRKANGLFHKLINTCVENFTAQKYFPVDSASLVLITRVPQIF
jgi:hypothetical protein